MHDITIALPMASTAHGLGCGFKKPSSRLSHDLLDTRQFAVFMDPGRSHANRCRAAFMNGTLLTISVR